MSKKANAPKSKPDLGQGIEKPLADTPPNFWLHTISQAVLRISRRFLIPDDEHPKSGIRDISLLPVVHIEQADILEVLNYIQALLST